jgi:hypothetical protein
MMRLWVSGNNDYGDHRSGERREGNDQRHRVHRALLQECPSSAGNRPPEGYEGRHQLGGHNGGTPASPAQ